MKKIDLYFLRQRLIGVMGLLFAVLSIYLLEGNITAAIFLIPLGGLLTFSKEMIIKDDMYFEIMSEMENEESR